jgi:dGTPase
MVHTLVDLQVTDLLETAGPKLQGSGWAHAQQPREEGFRLLPGPDVAKAKAELESFLYDRVYRHPLLTEMRTQARQQLQWMATYLAEHPERMPPFFHQRVDRVGARRAAVDYIAGMTDRFFEQQYAQFRQAADGHPLPLNSCQA